MPQPVIKLIKSATSKTKISRLASKVKSIQAKHHKLHIPLNLTKVSQVYKCVRVEKDVNNNIKKLILYDEDSKRRYVINPANYYLFRVLTDFEIQINNYTKNLEKLNKTK